MNIAIKCAFIEAGIMESEDKEPDIKELKDFMTDHNKLQKRTVKGGRILSGGSGGGHYLVEYIYHSILTKEQKEYIYTSRYEIGNPNPIEHTNIEDLYSYLENEYGGSAEDLVKNIKRNISGLINIPFKTFLEVDKSLAYKIITLFYRVCRKFNSQFFNLLNIDKQRKMNFEFRSSFPYLKDKGYKNTSILAEVLAHLTFLMPSEYLKKARIIRSNMPYIADKFSKHIRDYIELTDRHIPYSDGNGYTEDIKDIAEGNIKNSLNTIFQYKNNKSSPRLDFLLYKAIVLKEYEARMLSNKTLTKLVYETPLNLQSLQNNTCKTWEDKYVIPHLLGYEKIISYSIEKKTDFVERYILNDMLCKDFLIHEDYEVRDTLPAQNKQVLKALIIHDSTISNIEVDSFIFGEKNVPSSITSVLKNGVRDLEKSKAKGVPFSYESYPEALLLYWVMRYRFALRVVMFKDKKKAINQYQRIANWETRIDEALIEYVKNANLDTYDELLTLPKKLQVFLSNTIEPL